MKEELGFVGNQYNLINTVFTVGYVSGLLCNSSYAMAEAFLLDT